VQIQEMGSGNAFSIPGERGLIVKSDSSKSINSGKELTSTTSTLDPQAYKERRLS
jgi:hypothetical protein